MKVSFRLLFLVLLLISQYTFSQQVKNHAFSGTLMLGAEGGVTLGINDYSDLRPDIMGKGILEYYFPTTSAGIFSIRGFISGGYFGGKEDNGTYFRTDFRNIGAGVSYTFSIQDAVFPYLFIGGSYDWLNPRNPQNGPLLPEIKKEVDYHTELGIRFLLTKAISLNFNIGAQWSPNDVMDGVIRDGNNDLFLAGMVGMSYSLFTDADTDGDGIPDSKDQCPDTPVGAMVDDFGCPVDTDKDGVPDYKDKCPGTKAGMAVDENGCPTDTDSDGVPDRFDKCPNTPSGVKVNESGCPDTDNDGVFDNRDKCPNTPSGAAVDTDGCPKDTDGDGVPDYKDKCPNTEAGKQVNVDGCSTDSVVVKEPVVLSGDTNFESGKAALLPNAYPTLNTLAQTMKGSPETRWRIEGHTDAIGSDKYNMELSRKRAKSVADYLISQGVNPANLLVVPLGETQPIASNKNPEGRAMNRRVEIKPIK